jgi:adenylate cyclase
MLAYEFLIWLTLGVITKNIPGFVKFGNTTLETTVLTLTLYLLSESFSHPVLILLSPIAYLYFLFITLSTLRLSRVASLGTGALAGLEFYLLSLFLTETPTGQLTELTFYLNTTFPYLMKALVMLLVGGGAAFVAGQISQSVRLSIERMETNDQLRTLFGQQVSPEVVEVILEQDGVFNASHRKVAVLFLDIRNFTQYADSHTPEEVIAYQSAFFGLVAVVVQRHGGIVNQFLSDGCMATFGHRSSWLIPPNGRLRLV